MAVAETKIKEHRDGGFDISIPEWDLTAKYREFANDVADNRIEKFKANAKALGFSLLPTRKSQARAAINTANAKEIDEKIANLFKSHGRTFLSSIHVDERTNGKIINLIKTSKTPVYLKVAGRAIKLTTYSPFLRHNVEVKRETI
ncbi:hypothetical protein HY989_00195 [Candidatus Micrarchaeota archaeon]|nr:hypothetical protein [Candidatus Micrarchaeota archaeon]